MDWAGQLEAWCGKSVEIRVEDRAGQDPVAPPRVVTLNKVEYTPERTHLKCYLNPAQYISVPLFVEPVTRLNAEGSCFVSEDREAKLVYQVKLL